MDRKAGLDILTVAALSWKLNLSIALASDIGLCIVYQQRKDTPHSLIKLSHNTDEEVTHAVYYVHPVKVENKDQDMSDLRKITYVCDNCLIAGLTAITTTTNKRRHDQQQSPLTLRETDLDFDPSAHDPGDFNRLETLRLVVNSQRAAHGQPRLQASTSVSDQDMNDLNFH